MRRLAQRLGPLRIDRHLAVGRAQLPELEQRAEATHVAAQRKVAVTDLVRQLHGLARHSQSLRERVRRPHRDGARVQRIGQRGTITTAARHLHRCALRSARRCGRIRIVELHGRGGREFCARNALSSSPSARSASSNRSRTKVSATPPVAVMPANPVASPSAARASSEPGDLRTDLCCSRPSQACGRRKRFLGETGLPRPPLCLTQRQQHLATAAAVRLQLESRAAHAGIAAPPPRMRATSSPVRRRGRRTRWPFHVPAGRGQIEMGGELGDGFVVIAGAQLLQ